MEFLPHLGRLAGDRLLVIWDGSLIHQRTKICQFVEAGGKIHVEPLPSYAPDLNPVEWMLASPEGKRLRRDRQAG
jgi:transposase